MESVGSDAVFLGFYSGKVLRSTDGGINWNMVKDEDNLRILDIAFLDYLTGFVFGDQKIWKTEDGGDTFIELGSTPYNFKQAVMVSDTFGVALGTSSPGSNQGYIYQTNTGWQDFDQVYNSCQGLSAMTYKADNESFWFCGNGGNIEAYGDMLVSSQEPSLILENKVTIAPNPGTNVLHIYLDAEEHVSNILVVDATGKLVFQSDQPNYHKTITLSTTHWRPGIYFILGNTPTQSFSKKWVKVRE